MPPVGFTNSVKFWKASGLILLLELTVNGKVPCTPGVTVPLNRPPLVSVKPLGRSPAVTT